MTTISTDITIDQAWVNNNTGPFTITNGATVTFLNIYAPPDEGNITFNITNNKYFQIEDGTLDGNGKKATLENGSDSIVRGTTTTGTHYVKNLGVLSGAFHSLGSGGGGVYCSMVNNTTSVIENCYYFGPINGQYAGGIYGANFVGGTERTGCFTYIKNCYVIGQLVAAECGGIAGTSFGNGATGVILNSYHIGSHTVSDAGGICGTFAGRNSGRVYVWNCYHSEGNTFGTFATTSTALYVGSASVYNYNNSWSNSDASVADLTTANYYRTTVTSGGTGSNFIKEFGTGSYDNASLVTGLNALGVPTTGAGLTSMFDFNPSNTDEPWGIKEFQELPFREPFYSSASSQAFNCFCKGTKILMKDRTQKNIEDVQQGDEVMTPHGETKKVLKVGRLWYNSKSKVHDPYVIPKDFFEEGKPSQDTYCSGAHSLVFSDAQASLLGLSRGETKEGDDIFKYYKVKTFGKKAEYHQVAILKGEKSPYGFYYYHLVVENDYGYIADGLPSESITMKEFNENFTEINQNIIEEIN